MCKTVSVSYLDKCQIDAESERCVRWDAIFCFIEKIRSFVEAFVSEVLKLIDVVIPASHLLERNRTLNCIVLKTEDFKLQLIRTKKPGFHDNRHKVRL